MLPLHLSPLDASKRGVTFFLLTTLLSACSGEDSSEPTASAEQLHAGKPVYDKFCKVCHAQGINGAPILGNQAMWSERAPQGKEVLVDHAINGFGLMPANKGRNAALTDEAIAESVKYMLSELK